MEIQNSPSGRVKVSAKGFSSFVPHPMPPTLDWSPRLLRALSEADYALGTLAREGSKLPNPHLLLRPFVAREAVLSSQIEGTQATIGEVLESEVTSSSDSLSPDLGEVVNYIVALNHGVERLAQIPLSVRLLKEIHSHLMQGVRGSHATPGEFRQTPNWIGPPGSTLSTATYIPPTPDDMLECLSALEKFLHDRELPPLVHIALCHYQFEAIHPFLDGNGRVGRLLITLMLIERELLPSPLLYLSAFFEATRARYYELLLAVTTRGAWEEWLIYFLNGVATQSIDAVSRAEGINTLLQKWQTAVSGSGSHLPAELVQQLAHNPFLTIDSAARDLKVAYTTAQRAVNRLVKLGIVQEMTQKRRNRVYCATEILKILDAPARLK